MDNTIAGLINTFDSFGRDGPFIHFEAHLVYHELVRSDRTGYDRLSESPTSFDYDPGRITVKWIEREHDA